SLVARPAGAGGARRTAEGAARSRGDGRHGPVPARRSPPRSPNAMMNDPPISQQLRKHLPAADRPLVCRSPVRGDPSGVVPPAGPSRSAATFRPISARVAPGDGMAGRAGHRPDPSLDAASGDAPGPGPGLGILRDRPALGLILLAPAIRRTKHPARVLDCL